MTDADFTLRNVMKKDWQGRENRVIIVSCVRSQARFLEDDFQKGLGLFKEAKRYLSFPSLPHLRISIICAVYRMNVAITRAKELLVVIGNPRRLQEDPYWKSYLQFALRNNLSVVVLLVDVLLIPTEVYSILGMMGPRWISKLTEIISRSSSTS